MRILILNCYSRNALAAINGLDPSYELIGGAERKAGKGFIEPGRHFKSRRLGKIIRYRSPKEDPEGFRDDIIGICKRLRIHAILPTGTTATNWTSYFKEEIGDHSNAHVLVEDYANLARLTDKWLTVQLCKEVGVPVPKTVLVESEEDLRSVTDQISFPFVIKPRISYASRGVHFFRTPADIKKYLARSPFPKDVSPVGTAACVAQEVIPGELHDVTSCSKNGEVAALMSQQRICSLYDFGGGGIVNMTTHEPIIMRYAEKIIQHARWNGVMLFDFMKTPNGDYSLLECNPKIWGTTQLTIDAGLNVVQQLIDLFVFNEDVKRKNDYEVGMLYRWIFPECAYHWFHKPRSIRAVIRRFRNTFRRNGAKQVIHNLHGQDMLHLLGIVLDRGEL